MKRKVFVLLAMMMIIACLSAVSYSESYQLNDVEFSVTDHGYDEVSFGDLQNSGIAGHPQLPVEIISLIIPAGTEISNINITTQSQNITGNYMLTPAQPARLIDGVGAYEFVDIDSLVYSSTSIYPSQPVKVKNYGYFDGANKIATLIIYPIQYIPAYGQLVLNSSIDFTLSFTTSNDNIVYPQYRFEKNVAVYENMLNSMVANPEDIATYGHTPSILTDPTENDYDYILIVPDEDYVTNTDLEKFIEWKWMKGNTIFYRTVGSIHSEYKGDHIGTYTINDEAGSIREYILDMYENHGLTYVLLVGDETFFNRMGWAYYPNAIQEIFDIPTNFYYSELNGDWNYDGDNHYGEEDDGTVETDRPEYQPEVFVGRILIPELNNGGMEEINSWVEKLLVYETYPGYGDNEYLTKAFITDADGVYDSGTIYPFIGDYLISQGFDFEIWREEDEDPPNFWPNGSDVINKMNEFYGFTGFDCHGSGPASNFEFYVSTEGDFPMTPRRSVTTLDEYISLHPDDVLPETGNGFSNLANSPKFSVNYSTSCGVCDYVNNSHVTASRAFTSYIDSDLKGGPTFIGNSSYGLYTRSPDMRRYFFEKLFNMSIYSDPPFPNHIGNAISVSKSYIYENSAANEGHVLCYSNNLFGDPEMMFWTDTPKEFEITYDLSNNTVTVTHEGVPVHNACVNFYDPDLSEREVGYTNTNGIVQCTFNFNNVSITQQDFIPYFAYIIDDNENWMGTTIVDKMVIIPSGRTLTVHGNIELTEFAGRNAQMIVEDDGELVLLGRIEIKGYTKTYEISNDVIVPGNSIVAEPGSIIDIGNEISFISDEHNYWDGLILNSGNAVTFEESNFMNCYLYSHGRNVSITESSFDDSGLECNSSDIIINNSVFNNSPLKAYATEEGNYSLTIENNCAFRNANDQTAIEITAYPNYVLENSVVENNERGVHIFESGSGLNHSISNNVIQNNTESSGIYIYHSYADITGSNIIDNNFEGLAVLRNSNFSCVGNQESPYQMITYNENDEVWFTYDSRPSEFIYNQIFDSNHDDDFLACRDIPTIYTPIIISNNHWGSDFIPSSDLNPEEAFIYTPIWNPGIIEDIVDGDAKALYDSGKQYEENQEYDFAEQCYKQIISLYPDSEYAQIAAKELLALECKLGIERSVQDFADLKSYYETEPNLQYSYELSQLTDYLANYCDIKLGNLPEAISWFENVIVNPPSPADSIFAVIDAGYTYLLLENINRSNFVGQITSLKPNSREDFEQNRDQLLKELFCNNTENP